MYAVVDGQAAGIHPHGVVAKRRERLSCRDSVLHSRSMRVRARARRCGYRPALRAPGRTAHDHRDGARRRAEPFNCARIASATCSPNAAAPARCNRRSAPPARPACGRRPPLPRCAGPSSWNSKVVASTATPEIRLKRWSARRWSASICARNASTLSKRRSSRNRCTNDSERAAVEVTGVAQQMRLHGGLGLVEGRPDADIGHARVHDAVDGHRRRVDAVRRDQLVFSHHVRRRKSNWPLPACVPRQSCRPDNTDARAAHPPRPCGPRRPAGGCACC